MLNEDKVGSVPNNNIKIVFLASVVFLIIISASIFSFLKNRDIKLSSNEENNVEVLNINQEEINRMNAELDAIKASRPSTQVSLKEQVKTMDELRKSAIKQQTSNITTEEQQKELENLKSNTTTN